MCSASACCKFWTFILILLTCGAVGVVLLVSFSWNYQTKIDGGTTRVYQFGSTPSQPSSAIVMTYQDAAPLYGQTLTGLSMQLDITLSPGVGVLPICTVNIAGVGNLSLGTFVLQQHRTSDSMFTVNMTLPLEAFGKASYAYGAPNYVTITAIDNRPVQSFDCMLGVQATISANYTTQPVMYEVSPSYLDSTHANNITLRGHSLGVSGQDTLSVAVFITPWFLFPVRWASCDHVEIFSSSKATCVAPGGFGQMAVVPSRNGLASLNAAYVLYNGTPAVLAVCGAIILLALMLCCCRTCPACRRRTDRLGERARLIVAPINPPPVVPNSDVTPSAPQVNDSSACVVCMETNRDCVFLPCGHFCCCLACASTQQRCPLCRGNVTQRQRVFA